MAVWTFVFPLPDHLLSLGARLSLRCLPGVEFGWEWPTGTKVIQSGNKRNKSGPGQQEIKYDLSYGEQRMGFWVLGWVFFSNLYFFTGKFQQKCEINIFSKLAHEGDRFPQWLRCRLTLAWEAGPGGPHYSVWGPKCKSVRLFSPFISWDKEGTEKSLLPIYLIGDESEYSVGAKSCCATAWSAQASAVGWCCSWDHENSCEEH